MVLRRERGGGRRGGRLVPELIEPVVGGSGFGCGGTKIGAAKADGLAAGGVIVNVDDIGAGAVVQEEMEGGGVAAAANGVMETHFAVALAGAEIGIGAGMQHFLEAGEVVEIELAKKAMAEPGRFERGGGEDGVEDGVVGVLAGVVESFVMIGVGAGKKEQFGHALERFLRRDGGMGSKQDEAVGGVGRVSGEKNGEGAEIGGLNDDVDHAWLVAVSNPRYCTSSSMERLNWCQARVFSSAMRARRSAVVPWPVL